MACPCSTPGTAPSPSRTAVDPGRPRAGCGNIRPYAIRSALIALLLGLAQAAPAGEEPVDPLFAQDGYRIARFDAPVPSHLAGAVAVDTEGARQLIERGAVVPIDVLPGPPPAAGSMPGRLWLAPTRRNLPGSIWLPNVGYGQLSDQLAAYYRHHLNEVTGGDPDAGLLIYCRADCWMSWNAARRAVHWGYTQVHWYADGTTGWAAAGLPLQTSQPAADPTRP